MKPFCLLKLPYEIRFMIYKQALIFDAGKLLIFSNPPPLLQLCRQIREEATPTFYGENSFGVLVGDFHFCAFHAWTEKQAPLVLQSLRHITFYLAGNVGWTDPLKLIELRNEKTPLAAWHFGGQCDMMEAFDNAFDLAELLHKQGLSSVNVTQALKHSHGMMTAAGHFGEWHGLEFDEDFIGDMCCDFHPSSRDQLMLLFDNFL